MSEIDWREIDQQLIDGNTFSDQPLVYEIFKKDATRGSRALDGTRGRRRLLVGF